MKWHYLRTPLIVVLAIFAVIPAIATEDCEPCEEPEDPTLVYQGADPCRPKVEGADVANEPCKECDGEGGTRDKNIGTEVEVGGVVGRCCGGTWYEKDTDKEETGCWEWDDDTCSYICTDYESPTIIAEVLIVVEIECADAMVALPFVNATATDNCDEDVDISQSPAVGSGSYGVGDSIIVTLTAIDDCGNSATTDIAVSFVCGDKEDPILSVESPIDVALKCGDSKVSLPDVGATATDNCGEDGVVLSQYPEPGSGSYGNGDTAIVIVTATDGCGNSATETVVVNFAYKCPELQTYYAAKSDFLRVWLEATAICDEANDTLHDIRELFALIQAVREGAAEGLGELQELTPFDPGAGSGGMQAAIAYITDVIFPKLQDKCDQIEELCDKFNAANDELEEAYAALIEIFNTDCISRCNARPPPPNLKCSICGWLEEVDGHPCEFNAFGDFGQ